tara:strand:- start:204 stop:440 length:237 start_codon:yes stop_codon:yes gene_type:complete
MTEVEKRWTKTAKILEGKTISEVRYLTEEERDDLGWFSRPVVIFLDNGEYIFSMSDDEGNDAGALATSFDDVAVLPVI